MKRILHRTIFSLLVTIALALLAQATASAQASMVIQNADAPGVGFNDTTAATPIGGNSGSTIGAQRLIAFQSAASIWGATLSSSTQIVVRANWSDAMACTANAGTLGSAGAHDLRANFPGAVPNRWYGSALVNALSGFDPNGATQEIDATFNSKVGTTGCLQNAHWYYGLDNNHGSSGIDLVTVLLHEFAHGLGFQSFTDETNGQLAGAPQNPLPSIFDDFLFDTVTGKTWSQMNDSERTASAINSGNLVWNGAKVVADAVGVLSAGKDSASRPLMYAPNPVKVGSSVSHWDLVDVPNQLMEPMIAGDLTHSVRAPNDLTFSLLRDIGWPSPQAPTILTEQGTNNAAALDSVTHTRAPFANLNPDNLSTTGDTRARIIFLTTDLGLNPTDDLSVLQVKASGITLVVESAGPNGSLGGTSYIVVRLDGLPAGTYNLSVTLRGVNSTNTPTIAIQ